MTTSISRREFARLSALGLVGGVLGAPGALAAPGRAGAWPGYARAVVIDALGFPGGFQARGMTRPLAEPTVRAIRESGLTAVNVTVSGIGNGPDVFEQTLRQMGYWERESAAHPDVLLRVRTAADLRAAKEGGRLGLIYGFQDGSPLGHDAAGRLELFHSLGLRVLQPTYNVRNLLGDGCLESANAGLSALGRATVARANELGVLMDFSHCGQRTTADGIAASTKPVAITHTGCAALAPLPRNKRDEELRALADRGGVVGIYLMPFLRERGQPMADDVVRHVEHALTVCGEDHVGVGTDGGIAAVEVTPEYVRAHQEDIRARRRAGISAPGEEEDVYTFVPDLNTPRRFETLADRLLARGHGEARVEKLVGGNWARLFGEVWT